MTKHVSQSRWLKVLRTTAHLAIAIMWFMVFAAYLPNLLALSLFDAQSTSPDVPPPPLDSAPIVIPNSAIIVATAGGLLIIVLVLLVIKRFYIPNTDKVVGQMAEATQKQILINIEKRQPKLPKKEKKQIGRYAIEVAYLLLIAAPLLIIFIGQPIQTEVFRLLTEFFLSVLALFAVLSALVSLKLSKRV